MKYAICNEVYGDLSLAEACQRACMAGYTGIEIAPFTLGQSIFEIGPDRRRQLRDAVHRSGLEMVGLHWLLAGTQGLHLTSSDADVQQRTLEYLAELARLCRDLEGNILVLGSPQHRSLTAGMTWEQGKAIAVSLLKRLIPLLEDCQVTLAIEPLGPEETDFINTAEEAIELIDELDCQLVRLQLDVKAMSTERLSIAEIVRDSADWLVHFHANDPNRRGPGMGQVDFEPILKTLQQVDYPGWISVEVFDYSPGVERLVNGSIDYLQRIERQLAMRA